MGILEGKPKSQYALWNAIRTNSKKQRKDLDSILDEIQKTEDIEKYKGRVGKIVQGFQKYKNNTEKISNIFPPRASDEAMR